MITKILGTFSTSVRRLDLKLWIRVFAAVSTALGLWVSYHTDEYRPWQVRLKGAVLSTFIVHFGLWLATFEIRNRFRFIVALAMLPSLVGVFYYWMITHFLMAIAVFIGMCWIFSRVIRGKRLEL